jgi:site-specific recombinase XerD
MTASDKIHPPFTGPLGHEMRDYLDLKRSLGVKYRTEEGTLADFDSFLKREAIACAATLTQDVVQRWLAAMTCGPVTLAHKTRLLHRFFEHLVGRGVMARNPARCTHLRRPPAPSFQPYIFRKMEIAAILEAATKLRAYRRFPLRPQTVYTVLAILYGLGLRLGEACRLQTNDVDLDRSVLSIRQTKFHKARLVPFGPKLQACLARYLDRRQTIFPPFRSDDPLFVASGHAQCLPDTPCSSKHPPSGTRAAPSA